MIELLSPVGDFDCLKAAVQNGANAVYFGSNLFSARAFAKNFDQNELEQAINYAKLRGVKTHLTLNTLIKDDEFKDALNVAKIAYEFGIDALIVQDIGLARFLIKNFPNLEIHASTQMTTSNLEGVKKLGKLGFNRVVLSRECSISEIEHICKNSNIEIEVFAHGALCISYSGQCLFSSMVGGRSGNRGMCAQPCRLPYSLIESEKVIDNGYLFSPRDLCSLEYLPKLISAGVKSLKIEGRMKSPTYVATVTRIYRKYIDLAYKYLNKDISKYAIDENDKKELMQVFNRGGFSSGHLSDNPNKKLVYPQKPNNMGITLGKIQKFNPNKGLITVKLENEVSVGDGISFENESTKYTVSELMSKNTNIKSGLSGEIVTFGRMKGNIKPGDTVYKITDKNLSLAAQNSFSDENIKLKLDCKLEIKTNKKILVNVKCLDFNVQDSYEFDYIPDIAKSAPITIEKILIQFNKTLNTCFEFNEININLDKDLFIPTSILNEIRRQIINRIEEKILNSFKRKINFKLENNSANENNSVQETALLLNILHLDYDYSKLKHFDKIYIPLKYFADKKYESILKILENKSNLYIYMPVIVKDRYLETIETIIRNSLETFKIKGAVVSEISSIRFFKNMDIIANYNFNIFNSYSASEVEKLGFSSITLSPELTSDELSNIQNKNKEVIVYGRIPLMTMSYCLLGKSNKCYKECNHKCLESKKYYLNDRYNFRFRVIPDNIQTLTTIYNSRDISIKKVNAKCVRYDILDETIEEINNL